MVGNLSRRECTTVFYNVTKNHSDVYYLRVQMEPDIFRATFMTPVNVTVLDVPNPPELNDVDEVMEGTTVSLRCSAEAPCPKKPPTLSWSYIPTSANITTQIQEKPDKTQSVISTMTFNASYTDHKKNISCTVTYPTHISKDTTVENTITLQVLFFPKETHIKLEPNASVSAGTNVTLTCKSKANPSYDMNYTWYKRGEQKLLAFGEKMSFNVSKINEGCYFCRAENKYGAQTSEDIQLIVEAGFIVESSDTFIPLVAGCVGGALAFLLFFLLAMILYKKRKQRTQASNKPVVGEADLSDQDQNKDEPVSSIYMNNAFVSSEQPEMTNDESDTIHYGEINFSTIQTKNHTERSSGQEIIYAEVCHQGKKMNQD
ncbi:B-cell receptor CD22-like isoform X2 [Triplophysa rosa]|nr:B-cell receptor CD22-like isoform X2 [Triplophysa rosa]